MLEVGCGTMKPLLAVGNRYHGEQAVWGIDISLPLLLRARENAPRASLARADAERLPFRNGSFDLVWARHMLYHTERPEAVVRECRRCLGRAGVFAVSTNSARNKPEMHSFHRRLMRMHGLEGVGAKRGSERFPAENAAAILRQYFDHVLDVPYTGRFRFADAGEFLEYYASTTNFKLAVRAGGTSRGLPPGLCRRDTSGASPSGRCPTTEHSCSRAVLLTAYGLSPMARTRRGMPARHAPRGLPG